MRHSTAVDMDPQLGNQDLDSFFQEFRLCIQHLERAYCDGTLSKYVHSEALESIIGTCVLRSYHRLGDIPASRRSCRMRRAAVDGLLNQLRAQLLSSKLKFTARAICNANGGKELYRVCYQDQDFFLRLDQLIAASKWGIQFDFEVPADGERFAVALVRSSVSQFAHDLFDIGRMPQGVQLTSNVVRGLARANDGRKFEQLVLDILNESRLCARRARLHEDYLQKTDIRVRYPELQRKRGARVQVTLTANKTANKEKVRQMDRAKQYVFLSPWSLACSLLDSDGEFIGMASRHYDNFMVDRFWDFFADHGHSRIWLARELRSISSYRSPCLLRILVARWHLYLPFSARPSVLSFATNPSAARSHFEFGRTTEDATIRTRAVPYALGTVSGHTAQNRFGWWGERLGTQPRIGLNLILLSRLRFQLSAARC
ncbi:MAG: hypothetical protein NXI32_25170 [bacterium]|nr:hypothetical protein [bacterium]